MGKRAQRQALWPGVGISAGLGSCLPVASAAGVTGGGGVSVAVGTEEPRGRHEHAHLRSMWPSDAR
jgi:hypothetical protein